MFSERNLISEIKSDNGQIEMAVVCPQTDFWQDVI